MNKVVFVLLALAVSGCVTQEQVNALMETQRPPSAQQKSVIVNAARNYAYDPYSIRDAEISDVMTLNNKGLKAVCIKANAKNQLGGYTGRTATSVQLLDGQAVSPTPNDPACSYPQLRYHPFPELENLKNL
ncbi:hypothetical protein [Pararhizobium mangrovi]|uniref:Lipoprotein n=1 Tax=Pararhizobium mangrovi TaxID=2590452 RepID=A0A506U1A6_9HYPH|nr:hypothetical protein [Pararhizobium mangrovi]TPW26399.1 hypothetical protein FJU11_15090 [Pararhizobium mangrovi]